MSNIRVLFHSTGLIDIHVDDQHISRINRTEARDIILQILVFGGKGLRDQIKGWLDGKLQEIAEYIAPEAKL